MRASVEENFLTNHWPIFPRLHDRSDSATRTKMVNYYDEACNDRARLHHSGCPHPTPSAPMLP